MLHRSSALSLAVAVALMTTAAGIASGAEAKYPSWKGQWTPVSPPGTSGQPAAFDPSKPAGRGQQAPLTPEYQKVFEASLTDQANGGLGNDPTALCYAGGMPRMMAYGAQEYVIKPDTTYILLGGDDNLRRVMTDGRNFPRKIEPSYQGVSIGKWIDEDGDGTYDVLEVETRGPFKGPRAFDASGLPLAVDNESTFKERFFIDKADPNLLHDVITVVDHALTRPWTVDKTFRRNADAQPEWPEEYCHVTSRNVVLGKEAYRLDDDNILMPTRKDQPPPDLRFFSQTRK
jgi:hypothetical protein